MTRTTVTVLFLVFSGFCLPVLAQRTVKPHANAAGRVAFLEISNALPYTSAQPGHYLLGLSPNTRRVDISRAGFEVVRQVTDDYAIVKFPDDPARLNSHVFKHINPVNYLWKLAEPLLSVSLDAPHVFTIKVTDQHSTKVSPHREVQFIRTSGNIILARATLRSILHHIIRIDAVEYIGLESRIPMEESRVLDLNLGPNTVNQMHHYHPDLSGSGITLSMQELRYNSEDIDLHGRHVASFLEAADVSNHATDMATIAAGAGNSFITGRGVAYDARITSSDFTDLMPDRDQDYATLDAWVQNHSYGTVIENFYGTLAEAYDQSANRNLQLLHIFSSGNQGAETSTAGPYKDVKGFANLTGNFKMAKNILTVGAVDTIGSPVLFSSRGPAYDGRVKPDLVAYSTQGTSNATALVSGVAVILQQAYKEKTGALPPSAFLKSLLINSAADVGAPGPDFVTGYGNVDGYRALREMQADHYFSGSASDQELRTFALNVPSGVKNLRITLVWNDPAAQVNSNAALVNDLDLTLNFAGNFWQPWILNTTANASSLNQAATRGPDHVNNIEQVLLEEPTPGTYTIQVHGFDVPDGTQQFYICYQWDVSNQFEWKFPTGSDNMPYNGETGSYFYWRSTLPDTDGTLEYSLDNGTTWIVIAKDVDLNRGYFRWQNIPYINSTALARMVVGANSFPTEIFSVSRPLDVSVGFNCADSVLLQWHPFAGVSQYQVYAYLEPDMQKVSIVADTAFIFNKGEISSSLFAVQPLFNQGQGIRSPAYDYRELGTGCFIFSFVDEVVPNEGIYLNLELGTTYAVDRIIFEHQSGREFEPVGTVEIGKSSSIRFLHSAPTQGYNRYRARLQLQNNQEVISDTLENFFITQPAFQVFPNPVSRSQQLRVFSKAFENQEVIFTLYRTDGTLLVNASLLSDREFIEIDQFPPGLYVYSIQSQEGYHKGKLIIAATP